MNVASEKPESVDCLLIHVAVGVIVSPTGKILISKRPDHVHQGGLWEFPGGKVDGNETVEEALARELYEELGITSLTIEPLIGIRHDYPDKSVFLDVWYVTQFVGEPTGNEGQAICWVERLELGNYQFPAANQPIIAAL